MLIGTRLRYLREQRHMSQGDVENKTGLLRCYISRVENGHTVPSLETLERFAGALDVPLYKLFYSGEDAPSTPNLTPRKSLGEIATEGAATGEDTQFVVNLANVLTRLTEPDRNALLNLAQRLATR